MGNPELAAVLQRWQDNAAEGQKIVAELARVLGNGNGAAAPDPIGPDLLTASEAAALLGCTRDWLYDNASRLTFARRIGPKTGRRRLLRFSKSGIQRHIQEGRSA